METLISGLAGCLSGVTLIIVLLLKSKTHSQGRIVIRAQSLEHQAEQKLKRRNRRTVLPTTLDSVSAPGWFERRDRFLRREADVVRGTLADW